VQAGLPRPGLARRDDGGAVDDDAQPKQSQSDRKPPSRCQLHPRPRSRSKGTVRDKPGGRAMARYQDIARDEIVVPIPTYEKISGPGAKSGADQDDRCRHRQSHGERAANRQDECGKQIYLRPQAVYRPAHTVSRSPGQLVPEDG
jgi:hypothetical protein